MNSPQEGSKRTLIYLVGSMNVPCPTHQTELVLQVVGVKDERLGEQVCACITLKEGESCTPEEIQTFCKDQVS